MSRFLGRPARRRVLTWSAALAVIMAVTVIVGMRNAGSRPIHADARTTIPDARPAAAHSSGPLRTLSAGFRASSDWGTGYTGRYTITDMGTSPVTGWTLTFLLPAGTSISTLWDGDYTADGHRVTVRNASWDATVTPGHPVSFGFETSSGSQAGLPGGCTINGAGCAASGSATGGSATGDRGTGPATPAPVTRTQLSVGSPSAVTAGFAPYVDATLYPVYNLVSAARRTGVRQFNLAFIVAGGSGGCTPAWGGTTPVGADPVAAQIGALRAIGGDVRISFGGEAGSELAVTCDSVSLLTAAYQKVISAYNINKVDFDIEGTALADTAANARRDQALAALQDRDKGLQVSLTLPVLPSGLTPDGVALLAGAAQAGVRVSAVDIMTMDYGDGAAPGPSGMMGSYAIDAADAADAQVAGVLGISDGTAWSRIAITPMIGVNDISDEIFTIANARQLESFAARKHLAWLSMWSAARDTQCQGGAQPSTRNTCSSIVQSPDAFARALGAY